MEKNPGPSDRFLASPGREPLALGGGGTLPCFDPALAKGTRDMAVEGGRKDTTRKTESGLSLSHAKDEAVMPLHSNP